MKNKIIILAYALLFLLTNESIAAQNKIQDKIRFATEATYPPFEYASANGEILGFDIDIAKALCKEINAECTFSSQPFDSLVPSLNIGKFDAVIATLGITKERGEKVELSKPYYTSAATLISLKTANLEFSLSSLKGKTIGIQIGSTFGSYLQDKFGDSVKVNAYASIENAFLDLDVGRIDVVMGDAPIIKLWIKTRGDNKNYKIMERNLVSKKYFGQGYGVAVKKGNIVLLNKLNQALDKIKSNGSYEKIKNKYFK